MSKQRKPRKVVVDRVRARVIRGPKGDGSGRWYWQAVVYEEGQQVTVWRGWALRAAVVSELSDMVASGALERRPAVELSGLKTLQELLSAWFAMGVDTRHDLSPYTKRNYRLAARHWISTSGDVRLGVVDVGVMERHRDRRLHDGAAPGTVKRELVAMRTCWQWARERGVVVDRRLPMPSLTEAPVRDRHTPTRNDVAKVLDVLDRDDRPLKRRREVVRWPWLAVHILAATGARVGEVAKLRWSDVDLDQGLLILRGKRTRRSPSGLRTVPIEQGLRYLLVRWRHSVAEAREPDFVMGVAPKTVTVSLSAVYLASACEAAGVRPFTPHGLRRYAEDRLANSGVDIAEYAAIMGHSPAVALQHYRRATSQSMRHAIEQASMSLAMGGDVIPFPVDPRDRHD